MKNKLTKGQKIEIKNLKKEFNKQKRINLKEDGRFDNYKLISENTKSAWFLMLLAFGSIPLIFSFSFIKFLPFYLPTIGLAAAFFGGAGLIAGHLHHGKMQAYKELYKKDYEDLNEKIALIENGKEIEKDSNIEATKDSSTEKVENIQEEQIINIPSKNVKVEKEEEMDR